MCVSDIAVGLLSVRTDITLIKLLIDDLFRRSKTGFGLVYPVRTEVVVSEQSDA